MNRREITPEYVYITIPSEYVCVYHRILAMLSDYGEEMLKDCKANCTDKNSGVIECFNMFNAAVAARHLGQDKKAKLIIDYIKAKINQIYKGTDNSTGFVFPVDENGALKAFVSCNDRPRFWVNDYELYKLNQGLGYEEKYSLDDEVSEYNTPFDFECEATCINNVIETNLHYTYNGSPLEETDVNTITTEYYVNGRFVPDLSVYTVDANITVALKVVAYFKGDIRVHNYVIELL